MISAVLVLIVVLTAVALIHGDWQTIIAHREQINRLWKMIEDLEADKRALTESLCRAQGKPYISNDKREFRPSDGWFDGQPRIEVKD